jgi:uncharacterized protein
MASEFSGVGWRFPIQIANGKIAAAQGEDTVRQAIWMILGTTPGERPMRPDFGCGIHALVFAPVNPNTLGQLASEVQQALIRWEPRIDVISVNAEPVTGRPQEIAIAIDYRVRANNSRFNLVYPFYLE